ncbi:MAG: phage holin family protein [Leptospiraceae bacterium]|nr:phage holin family protein [Leptospiraceae bacterium]
MKRYLIAILLQILAVLFAFPLINSSFKVSSDWKDALIVVILFSILNVVIRWILVIFTLGIGLIVYYLTLGIAGLLINAFVLILIGKLFPNLITVPSFFSALIGGGILTLLNYIIGTNKDDED